MKNKPFALLGINSDGERDKVVELLKKEGITWRNAIDRSTDGPLARKWNVQAWPTIYVLDAKGVIRYRDARGEWLDRAVEALLKEMEK